MSPAARCDQIVEMIDHVLDHCGAPAARASVITVSANDAGHGRDIADDALASGLRTRLQRDVMGPFWTPGPRS